MISFWRVCGFSEALKSGRSPKKKNKKKKWLKHKRDSQSVKKKIFLMKKRIVFTFFFGGGSSKMTEVLKRNGIGLSGNHLEKKIGLVVFF